VVGVQLQVHVQAVGRDGRALVETVQVERVLLAGYTGRDRQSVMDHIHELEGLGVAPPPRVPMVYEVPPELVTQDERVVASGPETSGEVEFFLLEGRDGLLVGLGSDHTDRQQEAIDVAESKRLCAKVISRQVWRVADVRDHWDQIEIRAWATDHGQRGLYQQGRLDAFLALDDLLTEVRQAGYPDLRRSLVFGGTIPALSGFVYASRFEAELRDPVLDRQLALSYAIEGPTAKR
jgi:hypothetical protein